MTQRMIGRLVVIGILWLAFALRLGTAVHYNYMEPNSPERLNGDEPNYDNTAREILAGYGFTWPGRVPLYPLWLAGIYKVTDGSYDFVLYAQAVLGVGTVTLCYCLGRTLFGKTAGWLTAFFAAISYILVHQSLHFLSEVLYTPLVILVVLYLWQVWPHPTPQKLIGLGVLLGITNLVRPTMAFFPFFLTAVWLLWFSHKRQALKQGILVTAVSLLTAAPWLVYISAKEQAFVWFQTSNAILWQGSPEYYHLIHDEGFTYRQIWSDVLYGPDWREYNPNSVIGDRYWTHRALRSIAAEPGVYLRFAGEKLFTYWVGDPNADWGDTYVFNYSALLNSGFSPKDALWVMIARALPLLAAVVIWLLRKQWPHLLPLYTVLVYFTLLHAATHAEARLSEPLQPILLVLFGGIGGQIATRWTSSKAFWFTESGISVRGNR